MDILANDLTHLPKSDCLVRVTLPVGHKGNWEIIHRVIDHLDFEILLSGRTHPDMGETYTQLVRWDDKHQTGVTVMSDTPAEQYDHARAVYSARGNCLINGLGIGMVLKNILLKPEVTHVTVIELSQDLIDLVGPHYTSDPRVEIVRCSAFDYQPPKGTKYDWVWHDIWDTICSDNLPEMEKLHRKYGHRTKWQGSWCHDLCRYYRNH